MLKCVWIHRLRCFRPPVIAMIAGALLVSGCGGSSSSTNSSSNGGPTLTSISVNPLNPTIDVGGSQQFFATANFSDKSTLDITKSTDWSSTDASIATIESSGDSKPGFAKGVALGPTTVKATYKGMTGTSGLTVASNAVKVPIMDMNSAQNYLSFPGGLYEGASNLAPADHNTAGLAAAAAIQPLDSNGIPLPAGKVVFVAIGRSTELDEISVFLAQANASTSVNHTSLIIANGAQSGALPCVWTVPSGAPPCDASFGNPYDYVRDSVLAPLGASEKQVQAVWVEEYNSDPGGEGFQTLCDPNASGCTNSAAVTEAVRFEQQLGEILRAAKTRWPNLRQAFHSSRL